MSRDLYIKRFKFIPLQNTDVKLKPYTGEELRMFGQMPCKVMYRNQEQILPMIVAENKVKQSLLGRIEWKNSRLSWMRSLVWMKRWEVKS